MDKNKPLYYDFLKNKSIYNLNVSYWRIKLQIALHEKISSKEQLIKNIDSQGKGYYDGNPIFSFYNEKKNKAIRVIQEDSSEIVDFSQIKLLDAWIDKIIIPEINNQFKEVPELVISIFLTQSSAARCLALFEVWFHGDLSHSNLDSYLNV